jgi:argininosuccinate synthase
MPIMKTVVLAYSGGLDASVCIPRFIGRYGYDQVITVAADGGQPAPKYITEGKSKKYTMGARR